MSLMLYLDSKSIKDNDCPAQGLQYMHTNSATVANTHSQASTKLFRIQLLQREGHQTKGHNSWQWCVSTTAGLKYRLALSLYPLLHPQLLLDTLPIFLLIKPSVSFFVCLIQAIWERLGRQERSSLRSYSGGSWDFPLGQLECDVVSKHTN